MCLLSVCAIAIVKCVSGQQLIFSAATQLPPDECFDVLQQRTQLGNILFTYTAASFLSRFSSRRRSTPAGPKGRKVPSGPFSPLGQPARFARRLDKSSKSGVQPHFKQLSLTAESDSNSRGPFFSAGAKIKPELNFSHNISLCNWHLGDTDYMGSGGC